MAYQVQPSDMNPTALEQIIGNENIVELPRGSYDMDAPIILPDQVRGWAWDDFGPEMFSVCGQSPSSTIITAQHQDWCFKQLKWNKGGVRFAPRIGDLQIVGTPMGAGGIHCKGWRSGILERLRISGYPAGVGIMLDGNSAGGSWYNTITQCMFGGGKDSATWLGTGINLAGNAAGSGKTNENTVSNNAFWNCTHAGVKQSGANEGSESGAYYNRTRGNTFYAQQALFTWTGSGQSFYKPAGIYHDCDGGFYSDGDYFERVYYPVYQSQAVTDNRFHIDPANIKNSGEYKEDASDPRGFSLVRYHDCYREGGGFKGNVGHNIWRNSSIMVN